VDRHFKVFFWAFAFLILLFQGCKIKEFEANLLPSDPGLASKKYLLEFPSKAGFGGEVTFSKLEDGTCLVNFQLQGVSSESRYFAKLTTSNAADFVNNSDLADLGEISGRTGSGKYWLKKNYKSKPIMFDSILIMDAKVRILELDPSTLSPKEVLRGDIGSNTLLEGSKSFPFSAFNNSGISGQVEIRQRQNGKFFISTTLSGLESGSSLPVSFFKGSYETGNFEKVRYLGNYSSGQEKAFYSYDGWSGNLSLLDTLVGFMGMEAQNSTADSLRLVSICNFGGNTTSGREKSYSIIGETDSSIIGKLSFFEVGSKLRMRFQPINIPTGNQWFFSLNKGNTFASADSFFYVSISSSQNLELSNIPKGNGSLLSFDDLSTWNAHARITEPGFSNQIGKADLGANEVLLNDSLAGLLSEINPVSQSFSGQVFFRPRLNGQVICFYKLTGSVGFAQNNLIVRAAPKPGSFNLSDTTSTSIRIASFLGGTPGPVSGTSELLSPQNEPISWNFLKQKKSEGAYFEYNFSDEGYIQEIFSRGDFIP
jgi:hypothetical protein